MSPEGSRRYALILGGRRIAADVHVTEDDFFLEDGISHRQEVMAEVYIPDDSEALRDFLAAIEARDRKSGFYGLLVARLRDEGGEDGLPCDEALVAAAMMGDKAELIDFAVDRMQSTRTNTGVVHIQLHGQRCQSTKAPA